MALRKMSYRWAPGQQTKHTKTAKIIDLITRLVGLKLALK